MWEVQAHYNHTRKTGPRGRARTSSLPDAETPCHLCWAVREAAGCTFCRWRATSLATVPGEGKRRLWEEKALAPALPGSAPRAGYSLALPLTLWVQNRPVPSLLRHVQGLATQPPSLGSTDPGRPPAHRQGVPLGPGAWSSL